MRFGAGCRGPHPTPRPPTPEWWWQMGIRTAVTEIWHPIMLPPCPGPMPRADNGCTHGHIRDVWQGIWAIPLMDTEHTHGQHHWYNRPQNGFRPVQHGSYTAALRRRPIYITYIHTNIHTFIHTYITYIHSYIHAFITYITHTHTYIHT